MKPCFPVYEEMNPIQRRHTHKAERKMCTDIVQIMEICRIQKRRKPYPTQLFPLLRHVQETLIVRHETDDHARTARDPSAEARWWSFTAQGGKRAGQGVRLLGQQFLLLSHLKGKILFVGKIPREQPNCLLGGAAPRVVACVSNAEPTEAFLAFGTFLEHVLRPHTKHQSTLPGMQ